MARNPYYWGKRPALNEILFETYQDADTMTADLKRGALDAAWGIPLAQFNPVSAMPASRRSPTPTTTGST